MKEGMLVARTLLGDETMVSVARILNQTGIPCHIKEGDYFATAEPVIMYRGLDARSGIQADQVEADGVDRATGEAECKWRPSQMHRQHEQAMVNRGEATAAESKQVAEDYSHIQCLIERLPGTLTSEQWTTAVEFIRSHTNIFSRS